MAPVSIIDIIKQYFTEMELILIDSYHILLGNSIYDASY